MNIDSVTLIGSGGHAKVVYEAITSLNHIKLDSILDGNLDKCGLVFMDAIDTVRHTSEIKSQGFIHIAIGDNKVRSKLYQTGDLIRLNPYTIIHPSAQVSIYAALSEGIFVGSRTIVGPSCVIEKGVIINNGVIIEHDSHIGAWSHIAPGSVLCGSVTVHEGCLIGAGAVILPGITIGEWSVVGSGAVVTKNIPPYSIAVGVPAVCKESK